MQLEKETPQSHLTAKKAQVFITDQYKCFIKPSDFRSQNARLRSVSVEFLTEFFEPKDVDFLKVLAENEFYFLKESNGPVAALYKEINEISKHRAQLEELGRTTCEARLKAKLLGSLAGKNKDFKAASEAFAEKFEKVIAKKNSRFLERFLQTVKSIEMSIGLEFPGSLGDAVISTHKQMVETLQRVQKGVPVEVPQNSYSSAWMLSDGFMLLFRQSYNDEYVEVSNEFFELNSDAQTGGFKLERIECEYQFSTKQRVQSVKYYPEASLLVIVWTEPMVHNLATISLYELRKVERSVDMEPRHKLETQAKNVGFCRINGVENLLFSNDPLNKASGVLLKVVSLEETFTDTRNKPQVQEFPIDLGCHDYFGLDGNYVLVEGPLDSLALLDMEAREAVAYYRGGSKKEFFGYLSAAFSRSKNLLFILHNNSSGALVSSFSVNHSRRTLELQEDFSVTSFLSSAGVQTFGSMFFTLQFNPFQNRLDLLDDYQGTLLRFKLNDKRKLIKDKEPIKLEEVLKHESTPSYFFTRIEGKLFFLHFYVFQKILTAYEVNEEE